jgi:asparagine synthase (glutamine-hydrolysing)
MCGIAGLLDPTHSLRAEELVSTADAMTDALVHRGPDDRGIWVDAAAGVALGNRRLAVVGLGPGGHQPMVSASGRWVVTFNGEIYNFVSLRARLAAEGSRFRGDSDTEVLLEAIERWGLEAAVDACEGMFAVAAWDAHLHELHLLRDRLGEKPLYFGWVGRRFAFASELKSLRALPGFVPELDRRAVALFLRHNCVPAPLTCYRGIAKMGPGQLLTLGPRARPGDEPEARCYWSARHVVEAARRHPLSGPPSELVDRVEAVLDEAVAARMVADVPVGAFLSGGVDSSLVVALMRRHSTRPVKTFTVGFAERAFDESVDAGAVAAHLGTDHTTLAVTDKEALDVIPELPTIWDEPFADSSQIPTLLVSRLARSQVTVSLSGDGGDELFGGYNRHAWLERLWRRSAWLPPRARRALGRSLAQLPPGVVDGAARLGDALPRRWQVRNPATKLAKVGKVLAAEDVEGAYLALVSHWDEPEALVRGTGPVASLASEPSEWAELGGVTEQMLWLDLVGYLPDDILVKLDRAAMSASLESRVPFLDRAVVELAWRLPMETKLRGGVTKWALRQVLYRHVPAALVERPKMGFGLPIGPWLRGPLRPWAEDLLDERRLRHGGVLDPLPVRRAWQQHVSGRRDLGYELWDVLSLQAWLDRWMPA